MRDRRAEAQQDKGMSQTKVKSRMYASKLPTERSPVVKRVMVAETNTDAADSLWMGSLPNVEPGNIGSSPVAWRVGFRRCLHVRVASIAAAP